MDSIQEASSPAATTAKRLLHRLLAAGENRVQLFMLEVREERDRILLVVALSVGVVVLAQLAVIAWTAAIVIATWRISPVLTLVILGFMYGAIAVFLGIRVAEFLRQQQAFAATLDQLRKDRACFDGSHAS